MKKERTLVFDVVDVDAFEEIIVDDDCLYVEDRVGLWAWRPE